MPLLVLTDPARRAECSSHIASTPQTYYSTKDLYARYRCCSRTLFRWMKRAVNPLPAPCIQNLGSQNLWSVEEVVAWELREKERTRQRYFECAAAGSVPPR